VSITSLFDINKNMISGNYLVNLLFYILYIQNTYHLFIAAFYRIYFKIMYFGIRLILLNLND